MSLRSLNRCIPSGVKGFVKEQILGYFGVPYSRHGLPQALIKLQSGKGPVVLVDVGASEGAFTNSLRNCSGIRRALLIDPLPHRCAQLRQRFAGPDFKVVCAAAGDHETEIELEVLAWDYTTSLLKIKRDDPGLRGGYDLSLKERIKTPMRTLDGICAENDFTGAIDLLKLDVQGAEGMVLKGAHQTLKRVSAIWTEISFRALYEGSITLDPLHELCRANGFRLAAIEEGYRGTNEELLQGDALFVKETQPTA